MQALAFLRDPGAVPKPLYAVSGDDAYLRRESLMAIARLSLGEGAELADASRFNGPEAALADVLDEVRTLPFLAPRRLAIVDEADPFVTAHRKGLEAYAERPSTAGVLVLSVKSWPGNTKLAKLVEKAGLAVDCKGPPEAELAPWLVGLAKVKHAAKLDADAARLLVELVGPEAGLLAAEVEKLATFTGQGRAIGRDAVARMVGAGRVETIWRTIEAATTGAGPEALDQLDRLIAAGEHPVGLLAAMGSSLRRVHHAGMLRLAKRDLGSACREAGLPNYPGAIDKAGKQHAHLGPGRVAGLPAMLLRADLDLKGGSQLPPRTIMERLIVELARPRTD